MRGNIGPAYSLARVMKNKFIIAKTIELVEQGLIEPGWKAAPFELG